MKMRFVVCMNMNWSNEAVGETIIERTQITNGYGTKILFACNTH